MSNNYMPSPMEALETENEELGDTLDSLYQWLDELPYKAPEVIDEERKYYMGLIKEVLDDSSPVTDDTVRST